MKERERSLSDIEEEISRFKAEVEKLERENELLKFDLDEVKELNNNLSLEIDRLYQNISYLSDREN